MTLLAAPSHFDGPEAIELAISELALELDREDVTAAKRAHGPLRVFMQNLAARRGIVGIIALSAGITILVFAVAVVKADPGAVLAVLVLTVMIVLAFSVFGQNPPLLVRNDLVAIRRLVDELERATLANRGACGAVSLEARAQLAGAVRALAVRQSRLYYPSAARNLLRCVAAMCGRECEEAVSVVAASGAGSHPTRALRSQARRTLERIRARMEAEREGAKLLRPSQQVADDELLRPAAGSHDDPAVLLQPVEAPAPESSGAAEQEIAPR